MTAIFMQIYIHRAAHPARAVVSWSVVWYMYKSIIRIQSPNLAPR